MTADLPKAIEHASHALAAALRTRSTMGLAAVEQQLLDLSASEARCWKGPLTALAQTCRAARELDDLRGLGAPSPGLEPGSLPARLLAEIDRGARVGNTDLAELLGTDQWQVSRAGRRLRELGLVTRVRRGRVNTWDITDSGQQEVRRLLSDGQRRLAR